MVSGVEQRKRPLAPEAWQEPQSEPDWELPRECSHSREAPSVDAAEYNKWLREVLERLAFEQAEAQQLAWRLFRGRRAESDFTSLEQVLHIFWKHRKQERAMARLEDAAKAGDRRDFLEALKEIERQDWSPEDFTHAVRLALEAGAYLAARCISKEGAQRYPDDPGIQKYARALAPPRIVSDESPSDSGISVDQEWLDAHRGEYRDQWVAVRDGKLLGTASSLRELIEQVGDTEGALLTTGY